LELLTYAPAHGLPLVRRLVEHEITFRSNGQPFGSNAITIVAVDGSTKVFPWVQSYNWSRDAGSASAIVTSALMALEAWAHRRIDAGDSVDNVVADILGTAEAPVAYLLVAVDLVLSQWPASRGAAIPLLACPELLCLDRQRLLHDSRELPDIFGVKALQREPIGLATLGSLKNRLSRHRSLEKLFEEYAREGTPAHRNVLKHLLERAAARLGPPGEQSTFFDPEFMVVHALNALDPNNWHKNIAQTPAGLAEQWEYVPPETETRHVQRLRDASREHHAKAAMPVMIMTALNNPKESSPTFAAAALAWAQQQTTASESDDDTQQWMMEETIVTSAMLAVRDGGAELIDTHSTWIRQTFVRTLKGNADPVLRVRSGLQFNPIAIAFVGMVLLLRYRFSSDDVRIVLDSAGAEHPAAPGFAATAPLLAHIDERLPRAVLRCAFIACIKPEPAWRNPSAEAQATRLKEQVGAAIDAELAWLTGTQAEPSWPPFPHDPVRPRWRSSRKHQLQHGQEAREPDVYTDHQAAALWLKNTESLFDVKARPWLRDIITVYGAWTSSANGAALAPHEEAESRPKEWNDAFFTLLAHCLPDLTTVQITDLALVPITQLPDEAFLDASRTFLREVDIMYFNEHALHAADAVHVRGQIARRIMMTRSWERHARHRAKATEIHLGPAVAGLLFNDYANIWPPKPYLFPVAVDHLDPFLPLLTQVVDAGSFLLVAIAILNVLDVSPRSSHLALLVAAGHRWLCSYGDDKEFWLQHEVGARVCTIIADVVTREPQRFNPNPTLRTQLNLLLTNLIRIGIPEAHHLEEQIRRASTGE
jgi:hypothetical protein